MKYKLKHGGGTYKARPIPLKQELVDIVNDQVDMEVRGDLLKEIQAQDAARPTQVSNAFYKVETNKLRRSINYVLANK